MKSNVNGIQNIRVKNIFVFFAVLFCACQSAFATVTITEQWAGHTSKEITLSVSDPVAGATYEWTVDGNTLDGETGSSIVLPTSSRDRQVTVKQSGTVDNGLITVKAKMYGTDLYADNFSSGNGTKGSPYVISNDLELALLAKQVNEPAQTVNKANLQKTGEYFVLSADIDLQYAQWPTIGSWKNKNENNQEKYNVFAGCFDGKGYVVKNMHNVIRLQSGTWDWAGLFGHIAGKSGSWVCVTNLIMDNALVEKPATKSLNASGLNFGVVVAETGNYAEVSNIIVRSNCRITDNNDGNFSGNTGIEIRVGGVLGSINDGIARVFNISSGVQIDMFNGDNVKLSKPGNCYVGGVIGRGNMPNETKDNKVFPTDIYAHGKIEITEKFNTSVKRGSVFGGSTSGHPNDTNKWYYTSSAKPTGSNLYDKGEEKELSDFGSSFATTANGFILDNKLEKLRWLYGDNGFGFYGVVAKPRTDHTTKSTTYQLIIDNKAPEGYTTIQWYVDDKEVSDANGAEVTIPSANKERKGKVVLTKSGKDETIEFAIAPLMYGTDLYADKFSSGDGTKDNPYVISNDLELALLAKQVNEPAQTVNNANMQKAGEYFVLSADIDLQYAQWPTIGSWKNKNDNNQERYNVFAGCFDGKGHVVKNMHNVIRLQSGTWDWAGLFGHIAGNSGSWVCVTNLIMDNALVEKPATNSWDASGMNFGVVVAETGNYAEVSNIIVRSNCKVTDNKDGNLSTSVIIRLGGVIGSINVNNGRFFNISSGAQIDILNGENVTFKDGTKYSTQCSVGGVIGKSALRANITGDNVFPTDIYAHGRIVISDKFNSDVKRGNVLGRNDNNNPKDANKWYYTPSAEPTGSNLYVFGEEKELSGFGFSFASISNNYILDNVLDKSTWIYEEKSNNFNFLKLNIDVVAKSRTDHTTKSTTYQLIVDNKAPEGYTIQWYVDDKEVSGVNGAEVIIPSANKERKGKVVLTKSGESEQYVEFTIAPLNYGTDLYADNFSDGDGSKATPFIIKDDLELALLAKQVNEGSRTNESNPQFAGKYFELSSDIDLKDAQWPAIGSYKDYDDNNQKKWNYFAGRFNGRGRVISNMHATVRLQSGTWGWAGLFGHIAGTANDKESFACVTNLIMDNALVEKPATNSWDASGVNLGVVVAETGSYAEVSNIIVRSNCKITDNLDGNLKTSVAIRAGGVIGAVNKQEGRFFNISSGAVIDVLNGSDITLYNSSQCSVGGVIGWSNMPANVTGYNVFPTDIYAHGRIVILDKFNTSVKRGSVLGRKQSDTQSKNNWYYTQSVETSGNNSYNFGTKMELESQNPSFATTANSYLWTEGLTDKLLWIYSPTLDNGKPGFSFGTAVLSLKRGEGDVITPLVNGKADSKSYRWYVSQNPKANDWKEVSGDAAQALTLPFNSFDQYVYGVSEDGLSATNCILVPGVEIYVKLNSEQKDQGIYSVDVTHNVKEWSGNENLDITYEWKKKGTNGDNNVVGTGQTYDNKGQITATDGLVCHVVVKDKDGNVLIDKVVRTANVIYISPSAPTNAASNDKTYGIGNDENDGRTPDTPVQTWKKAYSLLDKDASWDENYIVLMGPSSADQTFTDTGFSITSNLTSNSNNTENWEEWNEKVENSNLRRNVTITGKYGDVDYNNAVIELHNQDHGLAIFGDTRFEYITFKETKNSSYNLLYCQYNNLEMGEGVRMENYQGTAPGYSGLEGATVSSFQIFGGLNNDARFRNNGNTMVNIEEMEKHLLPHGKDGFTITLKSGHYSTICAGGRQSNNNNGQNGLMGTPDLPIKCKIIVDIDQKFNDAEKNKNIGSQTKKVTADYDCGIVLAGNHEGAMVGDVDIIIRSGKVGRVVNGTLGNKRVYTFTENGTTYNVPYNTYMGRANILIDPASSIYKGKDDFKTDDERVIVTEVYGGSAGRGFDNEIVIDNPFYGIGTVTVNGGTFKILPWDKTNNKTNNKEASSILCGIYGAGAGGINGLGDAANHTPDDKIPYWKNSNDTKHLYFGNYEAATTNGATPAKYTCYNAENGTYTVVDPADTKTDVVINGGVFGSEADPIDGIYAAGSGYMSVSLWTNTSAIPYQYSGNLYGKKGSVAAELTINGGTIWAKNGVFAGGRGTDQYYSVNAYGGNDRNGTYAELGRTYGDVELTITGGTINGNVFGGGYGVADAKLRGTETYSTLNNMARVYGVSTVNITGGTINGNVYGGGDMAVVEKPADDTRNATNVIIEKNACIVGSVYGGGNGRPEDKTHLNGTAEPWNVGKVIGNTYLQFINLKNSDISPDVKKYKVNTNGAVSYEGGNVYGGGNYGYVYGNSNVAIYGARIQGSVYGGGNQAPVNNAEVDMKEDLAQVFGDIYGGGDQGNVDGTSVKAHVDVMTDAEKKKTQALNLTDDGKTVIDITGGTVYGNLYGGGNMATVGKEKPSVVNASAPTESEQTALAAWAENNGTRITLENRTSVVYGDIFGGGNRADVNGNTYVDVNDGKFAGDVFGGGNGELYATAEDGHAANTPKHSADVLGNTAVLTSGAAVEWQEKWVAYADEKIETDETTGVVKSVGEIVKWNRKKGDSNNDDEFIRVEKDKDDNYATMPVFLKKHNIYGGGNKASRVRGTATLDINNGFADETLITTDVWKKSFKDNANPHFYVFGGGYGAFTSVNDTKVTVKIEGDYKDWDASVDDNLAKGDLSGGEDSGNMGVFDNIYGIPAFTVLGVLGGGYGGIVETNTDVTVGGSTYVHRIYGGGFGSAEEYNNLADNDIIYEMSNVGVHHVTNYNREHLGMVLGNTNVLTTGAYIYGDVFGGGAGVESEKNGNEVTKDYVNMAKVHGKTDVTIGYDSRIYGSVYGGGDIANVENEVKNKTADYATEVKILGGNVWRDVFAGGSGRPADECADYKQLGNVKGNTRVLIADYTTTEADVESGYSQYSGTQLSPSVWRNIYGGCAYGTVEGNTDVAINGGNIGNDIFGGGFGEEAQPATGSTPARRATSADVTGNTQVVVNGGHYIWREVADERGNKKSLYDQEVVRTDIEAYVKKGQADALDKYHALADEIFDFKKRVLIGYDAKTDPYRDHNIYGGGNHVSVIGTYESDDSAAKEGTGKTVVVVNHGLSDDNLVLPGLSAPYAFRDDPKWSASSLCCYLLFGNREHPQFAVLGGGYGPGTKVGETDVRLQAGKERATADVDGVAADEYNASNYLTDYDNTVDRQSYDDLMSYLHEEYSNTTGKEKDEKYGGDGYEQGEKLYVVSRLGQILVVPNLSVFYAIGGGMAGKVVGNTSVQVEQTVVYDVFGGGIGISPSDGIATQEDADKLDYGQVGGNAVVKIHNAPIRENLYGGGAGISSLKVDGSGKVLEDQSQDGEYRDFTNIARVKGSTTVEISGKKESAIIYGYVFGGGDVASVGDPESAEALGVTSNNATAALSAETVSAMNNAEDTTIKYASNVYIKGGTMLQQVFAGGSGRLKNECNDYTKVGAIYGNTRVVIDDEIYRESQNGNGSQTIGETFLWNRLYGGGMNGTVYGNTNVQLLGGNLGYNIFGGGWGNVQTVTTGEGSGAKSETILTSADVKGHTNVNVNGSRYAVSQMWEPENRIWMPVHRDDVNGIIYSSQYNPETNKFLVNHNLYGGANAVGRVEGDTYVTLNKGLLYKELSLGVNERTSENFFQSKEWKNVYKRIGSAHFCVFGGGYGENTSVGNTYVNMDIKEGHELAESDSLFTDDKGGEFFSGQAVMDLIGGGYQGVVREATHVTIDGNSYMRRALGGSFYADITQTNITVKSVNADNIYGGGLMGDVEKVDGTHITDDDCGKVNLTIGQQGEANNKIFINHNVYGGNDVSGAIRNTVTMNIYGGLVYGNIYGAGNGDYLYAFTKDANQMRVLADEEYVYKGEKLTGDVVYVVPAITKKYAQSQQNSALDYFIESMSNVTAAQKLINIAQFRPRTIVTHMNLSGNSAENRLRVLGNVFGGGNTATVMAVSGKTPDVTVNIGNHVDINGVFMGSDGNALFDESGFMTKFTEINNVNLSSPVDWGDPNLSAINEVYIPVAKEERPKVYKSNLDLYFMPVEMSVQPKLLWNGTADGAGLEDCRIGTFVCGGNRGNMNVMPDGGGNIVNYVFPEGLTIWQKIVGGCNQANHTIVATNTKHEGGYLLGQRTNGQNGYTKPTIDLLVKCKFEKPEGSVETWKEGLNVYGGCYKTGTINGDVRVDFRSTMFETINDSEVKYLSKNAEKVAIGNVYGAGYGKESYVYGNTTVLVGGKLAENAVASGSTQQSLRTSGVAATAEGEAGETVPTSPIGKADTKDKITVMSAFGGGQEGSVIGNGSVRILNGHIGKSVIGGSYAGNLWGSTHVVVGYPTYYKAKETAIYGLDRTDRWNLDKENADGKVVEDPLSKKVIKQNVYVLKDDYISQDLYLAINALKNSTVNSRGEAAYRELTDNAKAGKFDKVVDLPTNYGLTWDDIDIKIGEAVYGGGYSVLNGAGGSGNYTVKKFDDAQNLDASYGDADRGTVFASNNGTSKGFGGNTTILVWDASTEAEHQHDHIAISKQEMQPVTLPDGTDLFNYYYKDANGNYRYIYQEGEYTVGEGGKYPEDIQKDNQGGVFKPVYYEYDGEGGLYGDGHFSFAEGFRAGDLKGYGFFASTPNGAKILNTLQRMDMVRLTDCTMVLLGARDYTVNEISTTPYSISRVGEIYMYAENVKTEDDKLLGLTSPKSRNYLGLSNNIHYVGAIKSNVAMTDRMYDADGKLTEGNYRETKQKYIDDYYAKENENSGNSGIFQRRNSARAKNMIGISSGYALKIQNVMHSAPALSKSSDAQSQSEEGGDGGTIVGSVETAFYGPIVGVVEMQLLNVRQSEAGGYVYADNIHHRKDNGTDVPGKHEAKEDFLETTGNFVFPYDAKRARYIVDDCFNHGYDDRHNSETGEPEDDAHYWYVTGTNYYYNVHITGYTSQKSTPMTFGIDNADGIIRLSGTVTGVPVTLKSIKWRSKHTVDPETGNPVEYACDLQDRNTWTEERGGEEPKDMSGHSVVNGYNLYIGSGTSDDVKILDKTGVGAKYYKGENDKYQYTEKGENGTETVSDGNYMQLFAQDSSEPEEINKPLGLTAGEEDHILIEVHDNVDNSTKQYYDDHLDKSCLATIVLTSPYMEKLADGTMKQKSGYIETSDFYTKTTTTDGKDTYEPVTAGSSITLGGETKYYYMYVGQYYELVADKVYDYDANNEEYKKIEGTTVVAGRENRYGIYAELTNVYNIYLTIDYIQGPNVTGNIKVANCALPGEYIRITPGDVEVTADATMAQNGTLWRIGKTVTAADGTTTWAQENGYYEYDQTHETGSEILKGIRTVRAEDGKTDILVPAYYFMNGYGVQYCYTVQTIDNVFTAPLLADNVLTVHNYHRMLPRQAGAVASNVDMQVEVAAKRHREELAAAEALTDETAKAAALSKVLPEPRIYLYDEKDLNAFGEFVNRTKDVLGENGEVSGSENATDYGNDMQFFVMDNITASAGSTQAGNVTKAYQDVQPENFKGTLHGNGHVISGLTKKDGTPGTLMKQVDAASGGGIYNLGITGGDFVPEDAAPQQTEGSDGASTTESKKVDFLHNCYAWQGEGEGKKLVYRMDGTVVETYSDDDFRYGRVAYDLNQCYLEARNSIYTNKSEEGNRAAVEYVKKLYANGDYLYAYMHDADNAPEYLRTDGKEDANYLNEGKSWHNALHPIDKARAVGYIAATEDRPESCTGYQPLFNQSTTADKAAFTAAVNDKESGKRNDYLFFGQSLGKGTKTADGGEVGSTIPGAIAGGASHTLNQFIPNRVFRAGGYYASKDAAGERYSGEAYYYNSNAYVHDNGISAIDFHGYRASVSRYYSPLVDNGLLSFSAADGVTRNLLVYANSGADVADGGVLKDYTYGENTPESNIRLHLLLPKTTSEGETATTVPSANDGLLHLVERTRGLNRLNEESYIDSEHNDCLNNDFDAPVAFTVAKRAWYTRVPARYAEANNDAWEGICLPFTANKVVAEKNGEITHFYGSPTGDALNNPAENSYTLHHEYWLRGMTDVTTNSDTHTAIFVRPGRDDLNKFGLFGAGSDVIASYTYKNTWFEDTYTTNYTKVNSWYTEAGGEHKFKEYKPLNADVPYIVSFPGSRFYEFDLSGKFYNETLKPDVKMSAQTVTFNHYVAEGGQPITIAATPDGKEIIASVGTSTSSAYATQQTQSAGKPPYAHVGTYLSRNDSPFGINATGTAFDSQQKETLPFRTYMRTAAASSNAVVQLSMRGVQEAGGIIVIGQSFDFSDEEIDGNEPLITPDSKDEDGSYDGNYLRIHAVGTRLKIESNYATTLPVVTLGGQLIRLLDIVPGTSSYSGFTPGIYLVGKKRLVLR